MRVLKPEEAFLRQVLDLAALRGWRVAHFGAARTLKGWRTPCRAQAKGFPDLLLVRGRTLLVVELKIPPNKLTAEQAQWLDALARAGVATQIWTPADWQTIEEVLA